MDIYFEKNYGKLHECIEDGKSISLDFKYDEGSIFYMFIKRKIPISIDNNIYYDIITPYGYGGPIITELQDNKLKDVVVEKFNVDFRHYCKENRIVSEFVRFHPVFRNGIDFKSVYNSVLDRQTIGTNLGDYEHPFQEEFSKNTRKIVRRILRYGINWKATKNPSSIESLKKIYHETMQRNDANKFYYFDDDYFNTCQKYFNEKLLLIEVFLQKKVIAAGLCFLSNDIIYVHLSGTLSDYINMSPAYILKYATVLWGKENNYKLIHYGGGRTNKTDDPLLLFKKKFGQNTKFDFYLGKKIWNTEIYNKLMEKNTDSDQSYFPAYRNKS